MYVFLSGAFYIKRMLMKNKSLQFLRIGNNKIGNDGVRQITEGLKDNNTFTKLMLWLCGISVEGT